ncbi:MAG: hypothetical protein PSV13_06295 [Lacunisphaera sp.]|nr:hypothetical protein [Lacunisphaera sp.]
MDWLSLPLVILRLALLLAGLLLPGSMILRALRLPWSLAAAFVSSTAALYVTVLVFACTGTTISLLSLAVALGVVSLAVRLVPGRRGATELTSSFACFTHLGWWTPLYAAFWAIVLYRLATQPLSGPDVYFRWSWLAEQMVQTGTLDFYPPRSGGNFVRYFWAESIPPGIASLYAWAYACAGTKHALWTSPVVALLLLSLHEIIGRVAGRWGGEIVARRAIVFAAACPLLTWSVLIGQETGLTAVAVGVLVWSLPHLRDDNGGRWAVLAGLFAVVAASAREYGPIFAVAAVVAAAAMRIPRPRVMLLALVALPLAAAWPVRVWLLTGNPFHSLDMGGLFPTNPVFTAWNDAFRGPHTAIDWRGLLRYGVLWALPATGGLLALAALLVRRLHEAWLVAFFTLLVAGLWYVSVGFTAGGLFYSLRVLSPALALLIVVAAYSTGLLTRHPVAAKIAAVVIALIALESLPKTLALPENPYRLPARDWLEAGARFPESVRAGEQELLAKLQPLPGHERIIADNASLQHAFTAGGITVLPFWSPEIAWLFDSTQPAEMVAELWRNSGLRYLVIGKTGPTPGFIRTHARWRAPYFSLRPVAETEAHLILEATVAPVPAATGP